MVGKIVSRPFQRPVIKLYPLPEEEDYIRTLPEVIEFNAERNPDHVFCLQARKKADFISVSHAQLKRAISRCIGWLKGNISELQLPIFHEDGRAKKGAPVALLLESDLGLFLYEMALISQGIPVLLLSARLSATAVSSLLKHTSATAIIASRRLEGTAREAAEMLTGNEDHDGAVSVYSPLPFDALLDDDHDDISICHPHHYIDESDSDVLILHSSGTTGLPKPIYVSHRHLLSFINCHSLDEESVAQGVNLSTLPLYHGFGLVAPALAMGVGKTVCFPPGSEIPNAGLVIDMLKTTNAASLMTVSSILEDISLMGDAAAGIQTLARLDFVVFGGGLLKPAVGDSLSAQGVRILNHYGTTESGPLAPIFVPSGDYNWQYFRLRNDLRMKLEEVTANNAEGAEEKRFKLTTFPFGMGGKPFEIQDQLVCNPLHPKTDFTAIGRNDDTIVLATGEKVQPQILEATLQESSLVKAAVAFGDQQFEIGVLVQPVSSSTSYVDEEDFRRQIWPLVLQASERMDDHARIQSIEAIVVIPSTATIPRTDKGSIARRDVYQAFSAEIEHFYSSQERIAASNEAITALHWASLEDDLKDLVASIVGINPAAIKLQQDLFELGVNSIQAVRLRRALIAAISKTSNGTDAPRAFSSASISRDFVYSHPSVGQMAGFFRHSSNGVSPSANLSEDVDTFVRQFALQDGTRPTINKPQGAVVLLTGATGSLGSHCLATLIASPHVSRVICLNRPDKSEADAAVRQKHSLEAKGLHLSAEQWSRVDVIESSRSSSEHLGLPFLLYSALQYSVTHILHTAWPMDFHRKLPSFQSQFQTLHNLLLLAKEIKARTKIRPRLTFISSIATVGRYAQVHGGRIVPECPIDTVECLNPIGYAEAKLVCERILEDARENHAEDVDVSYIRMGQIAGSRATGFWNRSEHFAALVASSQRIGALPDLPNTLSWLPVDQAADTVIELLLSPSPPGLVYQVENPVRQSWHDLTTALAAELGIAETLALDAWLERVSMTTDDDGRNPAEKLLDFFASDFERMACGEVIMGTDAARRVSSTLRRVDAVGEGIVRKYVQYWRSVGALK